MPVCSLLQVTCQRVHPSKSLPLPKFWPTTESYVPVKPISNSPTNSISSLLDMSVTLAICFTASDNQCKAGYSVSRIKLTLFGSEAGENDHTDAPAHETASSLSANPTPRRNLRRRMAQAGPALNQPSCQ